MFDLEFTAAAAATLDVLLTNTRSTTRFAEAFDVLEDRLRTRGLSDAREHEGAHVVTNDCLSFVVEDAGGVMRVTAVGVRASTG